MLLSRTGLLVAIVGLLSTPVSPVEKQRGARAIVLGIAQDGGMPHIGCAQEACSRARQDQSLARRVASLGLVDERSGRRFLIDATPDLPAQIAALHGEGAGRDPRRPVDGILLTHAHIGHYAGLMYLGREALGARGVPVYATKRMAAFLRDNAPWSQLITLGNIELRQIEPDREIRLSPGLTATAFLVPHRDEFSDTVGFEIAGPNARVLYIPDIDKWSRWDRSLRDAVARVDVALVDGTFESASEIPGRSQSEIPHPLIEETLAAVPQAHRHRLRFIHLNHTNRLLWDPAARAALGSAAVAREGEEIDLASEATR